MGETSIKITGQKFLLIKMEYEHITEKLQVNTI